MKIYLLIVVITAVTLAAITGFSSVAGHRENISQTDIESDGTATEKANPIANYGAIPLYFEPNVGQANARVKFLARGGGYSLFLTANEAVLALQKRSTDNRNSKSDVLRVKITGANTSAETTGENLLEGKTNYILGNDPGKWKTDIANYEHVRYSNIYDGVDVIYYGSGQQLEYDFVVSPGATPSSIALEFKGAKSIKIDDRGDLVLSTKGGEIRQHKPVAYQEINGERREVAADYVIQNRKSKIENQKIGFAVAEYDHNLPLVIDPVLVYSTYLGGNSNDQGNAIAVDTQGNAYIAGFTSSTDFPTRNPFQAAKAGGANITDAFVTKLNATGDALIYSTYLGGSSFDYGNAIAVDTQGNAYITGRTDSANFPTMNQFQTSRGGGTQAFVTKLNATGDALVYSTYLGATTNPDPRGDFGLGEGRGIAVDTQGNAYVTGSTTASNFPTVNPFQAIRGGASTDRSQDAFVTKFNATGSALVYSTYLGGSNPGGTGTGVDVGNGIAVDSQGNAYITGVTQSTNFPTQSPFQSMLSGGSQGQDAFVTKLNATGNALVYSTYLGGTLPDSSYGIAVDSQSCAYVTGSTDSLNFPTRNPIQGSLGGGTFDNDAFVTKLNATGDALVYSTYLGGNGLDQGNGISVDTQGNAYIAGRTSSTNFPIRNPFQATLNGTTSDAFVTKLNAAGDDYVYSTYLGGNNHDSGLGIAVDGQGSAYLTGFTLSTNFPTMNPFQATHGVDFTGNDAFVSKISDGIIPTPTPSMTPTPTTTPTPTATPTPTPTPTPAPAIYNFNATLNPASNTVWDATLTAVGWYITPNISMNLTRVETNFSSAGGSNRNVTIEVLTDRRAVGGTLLRSVTFNSASARGQLGGGTFASVPITAGITYFIGFRSISGIGINTTSDAGAVNCGACLYLDNANSAEGQYQTRGGSNLPSVVDQPILRLIGTTAPTFGAVDGRVLTSDGRGLRNATVSITDPQGISQTATTSSFGFFSFQNVTTGQSYTIRVSSRLFRFTPQTVQISGNLTLPNFMGLE